MKRKVVKKLPVLLAIMFVLFQSFLVPLAGASWSGSAWKGDSWTGDAWNAEGFSWEGEAWNPGEGWIQDGWEQEGWTQEGYIQDGWTGDGISAIDPATGQPWTGDKVNGINPATGQPWTGNGINGINPATGQTWTGDGINGFNPVTGQPWTGNGINGINPATGQPWIGNGNNGINPATGLPWIGIGSPGAGLSVSQPSASGDTSDEFDINPYDITKYVMNDLIVGQVNMTKDIASGEFSFKRPNDIYGLVLNGFKLGMGDNRALVNIDDAYGMVSAGIDGAAAIKTLWGSSYATTGSLSGYRSLAATQVSSYTSALRPPMSMLSKVNVATASIGTVFSAIDTFKNTGKAIEVYQNDNSTGAAKTIAVSEATASIGEVLMNGGAVAAAIPGGQAIGAGLIIAGAGTFAISKGVKLVVSNWGSIKRGAGKAGRKIGSLFKSIKGAFS